MIPLKTKYLINYTGMTLWPFLLIRHKSKLADQVFMNHENIHAVQQKELLIIVFHIWYAVDYFIKLIKHRNHNLAYRNIVFEREAYEMETDPEYLKRRKLFSFLKFYSEKYRYE